MRRREPAIVPRVTGALAVALAVAAVSAAILLLAGCAERRTTVEIRAHPPEWNETASPDFHGARVERSGPASCVPCHESDLRGAPGVPGCFDCHAGAGGHPGGWASRASSRFHGDEVAANGPGPCAACHGDDYRGGWSDISCFDCHAGGPSGHPDGWLNPLSASYHGLRVLTQGVDGCTTCHGFSLGGGTSGVACADCHG